MNVEQHNRAPIAATEEVAAKSTDFIHTLINDHLASGHYQQVVTRFPPEPNGFLHIGHAKSICLNFGLALDYPGGSCHLRLDDTDPTKEDMSYVAAIQEDIHWLGFDWGEEKFFASDYFEKLYQYALQLIQEGKAYVCSLNEAEIRAYRGSLTEPGRPSPYRDRSIAENLDLFQRMRAGEFADGAHVLRAKIDMANPNMKMRDPLLYRIRHAHHYRQGDKWCIYPMYDFAHPLSDYMEGITHSICTLEFENNRELYDWVLDAVGAQEPRPHQYEFARLNLNYTVMSKRKLLELVEQKHVNGWDDPRLPTISGLRRRGYTPESIRAFCKSIGIAKSNSTVDMAQLEFAIRDDLNTQVPRVLAVLRPLKVVIENYPADQTEVLDAPYYPHDVPKEGSRALPFCNELYIEQDDFMENPPKGYYRLSPGGKVRLRHAYIISCDQVIKDADGNVTELRCSYDPNTKSGSAGAEDPTVKGTLHWVSARHAVQAEVRLYDRLYTVDAPEGLSDLNPHSLEVLPNALVEPSLQEAPPESRFQFERQGYFCADRLDSTAKRLVFNRIVTLKDAWAKKAAKPAAAAPVAKVTPAKRPDTRPQKRPKADIVKLSPEQEATLQRYQETLQLSEEEARLLVSEPGLSDFFEAALATHNNPSGLANWIVNELLRELKETPVTQLAFGPAALAELIALMDDGTISGKIAKEVFEHLRQQGGSPKTIVAEKGLQQVCDPAQLEPLIDRIIAANPENVARFKAGKNNVLGFFVGQVMKETGGKANPALTNELIQKKLNA